MSAPLAALASGGRRPLIAHVVYRFDVGGLENGVVNLANRMDQRFVAAMADSSFSPLWRGKAKHLTALGGSNGVVLISANAIVYEADAPGSSRTWRLQDIENVSTTGPFDLTISTFEREGSNYGSHRTFRFQLKEALPERTYNELWRRLNPAHLSEQKENHPNE